MRKTVIILASFVLISTFSFSQTNNDFNEKDKRKIEKLGLNISKFDLKNRNDTKDLNLILRLDKKRKTNKILSIIFTTSAAISIVGGSKLIIDAHNRDKTYSSLDSAIGTVFVAGGVIYGGVSIPFWISSKKRKNERDKLIRIYQEK